MNYKILLLIGVCVKIATTSDCNKPADLSYETLQCCLEAWEEIDILSDTCFQVTEEHNFETLECMIDCFYSNHGFLVNGSIVLESGIRYLRSFGSKEFQDIFVGAYERCYKFDWDELTDRFGHLIQHPNAKCSTKAAIFDNCIALNIISRCPKHMLMESDYCTSELTFLNECIFKP